MRNFKNTIIFIIAIVLVRVLVELPKAISLTNQVTNANLQSNGSLVEEQIQTGSKEIEMGDYAGALLTSKFILENKDNDYRQNSYGYVIKGLALMGLGKSDEVEESFNKAIQINNGNIIAYIGRAKFKYSKDNFQSALSDAKEAMRLANLQREYTFIGDIDLLIKQIQKSIDANSKN